VQAIALADDRAPGLQRFQHWPRHVEQAAQQLALVGGEVAVLLVLEVDQRTDRARGADRHAEDGRLAQLEHRLDAAERRIVGDARQQHVLTGLEHAREQAAAEAAGIALEVPGREAVEHAVLELAALGDLDEQPALGAGARHRLLEDGLEDVDRFRHLAEHALKRRNQLGRRLWLGHRPSGWESPRGSKLGVYAGARHDASGAGSTIVESDSTTRQRTAVRRRGAVRKTQRLRGSNAVAHRLQKHVGDATPRGGEPGIGLGTGSGVARRR